MLNFAPLPWGPGGWPRQAWTDSDIHAEHLGVFPDHTLQLASGHRVLPGEGSGLQVCRMEIGWAAKS